MVDLDSKDFYFLVGDEETILPKKLYAGLQRALSFVEESNPETTENINDVAQQQIGGKMDRHKPSYCTLHLCATFHIRPPRGGTRGWLPPTHHFQKEGKREREAKKGGKNQEKRREKIKKIKKFIKNDQYAVYKWVKTD